MTMEHDLRQAALLQAREAIKKLIDFAGEVHQGEWFGPSGRRDNAVAVGEAALVHLAACTSEGVSGSDVPARPTSPAEWVLVPREPTLEMRNAATGKAWENERTRISHLTMQAALRAAIAASPPLPKEQGAVPPQGEQR